MTIPNYQYRSDFARKYYGQGKEDGLKEGLEPLVHLFERRLRRTLTSTERDALTARLRLHGAVVVSDVVLDLAPDDLAAWLASTDTV